MLQEGESQTTVNADFTSPEAHDWDSSIKMKAFNCPSCGAELIFEETTVASSCPYCGNTTVIASQFKGGRMPEYVIPFKIDKKGAIAGLKNYYKGKRFLPNVFSASLIAIADPSTYAHLASSKQICCVD